MRRLLLLLCACATLLVLGGCTPAPVGVRVGDDFFSPATTTVSRGGTVRWTNEGFRRHTTTGNAPLALWNASLNRGAQFDVTLVAAGSYAYHCTIHPEMSGSVKVPISVSPTSGSTATTFTVSLASKTAPAGFEYVVQKRDPGGSLPGLPHPHRRLDHLPPHELGHLPVPGAAEADELVGCVGVQRSAGHHRRLTGSWALPGSRGDP